MWHVSWASQVSYLNSKTLGVLLLITHLEHLTSEVKGVGYSNSFGSKTVNLKSLSRKGEGDGYSQGVTSINRIGHYFLV